MSKMRDEASSVYQKIANQIEKNDDLIKQICVDIKKQNINKVATVARGSSDYAANFAKYLFETELGWLTSSLPPSIATIYNKSLADKNTLIIGISQSGASPDLCITVNKNKDKGAKTMAIVNVISSPLADISEYTIPIHVGEERAVAATKSYIGSLVSIAHFVARYKENKALLTALKELPNRLKETLEMDWNEAVNILKDCTNMFILGRGYGFPIAQEMALKLKETAIIHAEAFSSAEVLHGPFALLNKDFSSLSIAQNDQSLSGTVDIVERMANISEKTLFACPQIDGIEMPKSAKRLPLPKTLHPILDPILSLQAFYLMVEKLTVARGFSPDTSENLNKVTKTI